MATATAKNTTKIDQPTFVWEGTNKNGVKIYYICLKTLKTTYLQVL